MGERRPIIGKIADTLGQVPKVGPVLQEGVETMGLYFAPTDVQRRQLAILDRWADSRIEAIHLDSRISNEAFQRLIEAHDEAYRRHWNAIKEGSSNLGEEIRG